MYGFHVSTTVDITQSERIFIRFSKSTEENSASRWLRMNEFCTQLCIFYLKMETLIAENIGKN